MRFCTAFKTLFSYAFFWQIRAYYAVGQAFKNAVFCLWAVENPVFFFRQNNLKTEPICALESIAERLKKCGKNRGIQGRKKGENPPFLPPFFMAQKPVFKPVFCSVFAVFFPVFSLFSTPFCPLFPTYSP